MRTSLTAILVVSFSLLAGHAAWCIPPGLNFYVSFDKLSTDADFAKGDPHSSLKANLELRSAEGVKGAGLLQQKGERCTYAAKGNLDTSQGTFSIWVKPLSWEGHSKKFRHILCVYGPPGYAMLVYLYCVGDEAVFNYIRVNPNTPNDATWRAGGPVDMFKKGEWTHLVSTWDAKGVRLYANGTRVGEGLVAAPLPKYDDATFAICPIDFWNNAQWGDPSEQTICDEVRIFDHALSDDEILDLYAMDVPGGLKSLTPSLTVNLKPEYFANRMIATVRPAHLDAAWEGRLKAGAAVTLTVRDPKGKELLRQSGPLGEGVFPVQVPEWADGEYTAEASLAAGGETLSGKASLTKPPTPWLPPERGWKADRVLDPWKPLERRGQSIGYWNGEVALPGALPAQITAGQAGMLVPRGEGLLTGPVRLVAEEAATWDAPRVTEEKPFRISCASDGKLGALNASAETLMEFDGLIRADLTLTPPAGGAELKSLTLEIPLRPEVATYYRNPKCVEWDGKALDEKDFIPYAWLGNEERGLSWFMESDANWRIGKDQPAMTLRREGESVVVRLRLISEPTRVTKPLTYTLGLEATPVRPVDRRLYDWRFASGPQFKGSNLFVFGWGQQISALNASLIAYDPAGQRKLVDGWRAQGKEALSYSCAQCTASISPEYKFFADEWNQPYGATFAGYKRFPDNADYSIVPVCPQSTFTDFLVWCVKEHIRNDWSGGIYTDIDGAMQCDNAAHGCGFTDVFGRVGRTYPLYAHRALSRRIYAACHDGGKLYFSHCHSLWYSVFNVFNDGWCPGEQYSSAVMGKPNFYMDDIPDRTWRTEFYTPATGAATFMLPELGRLGGDEMVKERGPSECLMAASMCYGVPLWAGSMNQQVVEEAWAAQMKFGAGGAEFVPFWKQKEIVASDPEVRVSLWRKQGKRLVVLANFTDKDRKVELRASGPGGKAEFRAVWKGEDLAVADGVATVTIPAKNGALVEVSGVE